MPWHVFSSPVITQYDGSPQKKALKYYKSLTFISIVVESSIQVAQYRIRGNYLEKLAYKFELKKNHMDSRNKCTGPTGLS